MRYIEFNHHQFQLTETILVSYLYNCQIIPLSLSLFLSLSFLIQDTHISKLNVLSLHLKICLTGLRIWSVQFINNYIYQKKNNTKQCSAKDIQSGGWILHCIQCCLPSIYLILSQQHIYVISERWLTHAEWWLFPTSADQCGQNTDKDQDDTSTTSHFYVTSHTLFDVLCYMEAVSLNLLVSH